MKRSEKNLILISLLSVLAFAYQNCDSSHEVTQASIASSSETPALGEKINSQIANPSHSYSVQETQVNGVTVKQYISSTGVVFALTWRGRSQPDLSQLLGQYFTDYQSEKKHRPRQHGMRFEKIETPQIVIHRGGHMRDLHGQAYDPRLLPADFSLEDLQ